MTTVSDHLAVPESSRDLAWICTGLQTAIELEAATLPLYLSALFSLEVQNYTAYNLIRSVVMEEMVHMATACNILAALGGRPALRRLDPGFPSTGLPGGAEPDLVNLGLAQLSKAQLRNFLRIEAPVCLLGEPFRHEQYPTIGALYRAVRGAISTNREEIRAVHPSASNQVGDNIGIVTFQGLAASDLVAAFDAAIGGIIEQGEGSQREGLGAGPEFEDEASHYARFAELYYGAGYAPPVPAPELSTSNVGAFFTGPPVRWPQVVNTLAVPSDGYAGVLARDPAAAAVRTDLEAFDAAYSAVLQSLDDVWNGPAERSWPTLGASVEQMMRLRVLSCFKVVRHRIPDGVVAELPTIYPEEIERLRACTDLTQPVFYGPRFANTNAEKG